MRGVGEGVGNSKFKVWWVELRKGLFGLKYTSFEFWGVIKTINISVA